MRKVIVKLNNSTIGITEMTIPEIRKAESAGFTIVEKLNKQKKYREQVFSVFIYCVITLMR